MTSAAERRRPARVALPWSSGAESSSALAVQRVAPWALVSAASMPVVLTTAWFIADAVQRRAYSPVRQTVSVLSGDAGTHRWIVTAALYGVALAYVVTAAGMPDLNAAARRGLLIAATAAAGVATFPVPAHGTSRPHAVCVVVGAVAITLWPALAARQAAVRAAVGPRLTAAAIVVSIALFLWTAMETRNGSLLGLAERLSSALQVGWPFVVALMLRRAQVRQSRQGERGRSVLQISG